MKKLKETENIFVLGIFLGICGAVAALVLAFVDKQTKEPIAKMKMLAVNNALKQVLPAFDNSPGNNTFKKDDVIFYGAKENGKLVAVAASGFTMKGYSGKIVAMVGLGLNGKIRTISVIDYQEKEDEGAAVLITEQKETPGLGTVVCERKRQKTIVNVFKRDDKNAALPAANGILDQFKNKSAGAKPWKVRKDKGDFDYKTGATVSSRAVVAVVYKIVHTFDVNRKEIIKELSKTENKGRQL